MTITICSIRMLIMIIVVVLILITFMLWQSIAGGVVRHVAVVSTHALEGGAQTCERFL